MRSGTSFFNRTVYEKSVLRFWPLWVVNLVFWGMLLPLRGLLALQEPGTVAMKNFSVDVSYLGELGLAFAVVAGMLAAMAACSHLYSARSANFMAALPIRREGLFVSHYAAGLTMLLAPNGIIFLLTLAVEAAGGEVELIPLLFWLISLSAMEFFFYSFALCLGMFAGHILALPVFYGVFNVLAVGVAVLIEGVMGEFYFGYVSNGYGISLWLTPIYMLSQLDINYGIDAGWDGMWYIGGYGIEGASVLGIYAVAAVVLTVVALLIYRGRHLETAGDVVAVKSMRPVFKYGVAICSGLFLGYFTALVMSYETVGLVVSILVWGIAGYFVAQMFLDKSFRVFRRWKGAAAVTAVFIAMFLVVGLDLTGFESRVPDAGQVVEVRLSGLYSGPYDSADHVNESVSDPEIIEKIVALHQAVVDHREECGDGDVYQSLRLTYTMEDGSVMRRDYDLMLRLSQADTPGTVPYATLELLNQPDFLWQLYGFDEMEEQGTLFCVTDDSAPDSSYFGEDAAALLAAVKADFSAGDIGRRELGRESAERFLTFVWYFPKGQESRSATAVELPAATEEAFKVSEMEMGSVCIALTDRAENTCELLKTLGE